MFAGTSLTSEWLAHVLEKKLGQRPSIQSVGQIEEASHGYMSQIRRVRLEWQDRNEELPPSVVVKAPASGSAADAWVALSGGEAEDDERKQQIKQAQDNMKKIQGMCHTIESSVYALFEKETAPVTIPKTFASFGMETEYPAIVMEDITGATICDVVDGFCEKQVYTILDNIINLHVFSFESQQWKSIRFMKDDALAHNLIQMTSHFATDFMKNNPAVKCFDVLLRNCLLDPSWFFSYYDKYEASDSVSVLAHGDMWCPQFLWRGDHLAAIVDWQLSHPGSIMEDLLHLLSTCIPASDRTRLTQTLLHYYYKELSGKLQSKGVAVPFSFDSLLDEYKQTLPYTAAMALFAFSMWSNSPVLKDGSGRDAERIAEILQRTISIIEETIVAFGWE